MIFAWLWVVVGLFLSPVAVVVTAVHPRTRGHIRERLGFPTPEVEPGAVWFHAASLGEGRIVEALIPGVRERLPGVGILRTCTSDSARAQATGADQTLCLPLDLFPAALSFLDRVRPRALILVEAELWPALILACRWRGIPIALVSPREGEGMTRLRRVPGLAAALLDGSTLVRPSGDLKSLPSRRPPAFSWEGAALVAACTHEGEESAILDAWADLPARPLLILAPRDPRRFEAVAALLSERCSGRYRFFRRTAMGAAVPSGTQVLLLDTLGELESLYERAAAAFIGGTLDGKTGGHSPAEALAAGCPVVRGPHVFNNAVAWSRVEALVAESAGDASEAPASLTAALAAALARPRSVRAATAAADEAVASLAPVLASETPEERAIRPFLWPIAPLWWAAVAARPAPLRKAALPVISIGGLTAGGTGKTPVAGWIAARIHRSVVVSRGYGRRAGREIRVSGGAGELGDELAMLARRGHRVVSSPDRLAGIALAAKEGARVAILDDGLQHRSVARDLEIIVIDARWPDGGGPIPVGTRRVPRSWLRHADVIWTHHGAPPPWVREHARPDAVYVTARYRPSGWRWRGETRPLDALPRRPALALAGIARPEGFLRQLRDLGVRVERSVVFPDHHAFSWHDLQAIEAWKDDHVVVTTEKDAARLPEDSGVWALIVELELTSGEADFLARLHQNLPECEAAGAP